jgi:catechol 2,3-dioxygenase-like lactoylglutathione lyase family enzyme
VERKNNEFDIRGVNHIALVCKDMARTVTFYRDVLGMPLIKTVNLGSGGQHFFFDIGNGDSLAFFWFPDAPPAQPGYASPAYLPTRGDFRTAHGSMNHLAFDVPVDRFLEFRQRLIDKGVDVTDILDHDDSPSGIAKTFSDEVYVRSIYFYDPDGVALEFASWNREMGPGDVNTAPKTAAGIPDESLLRKPGKPSGGAPRGLFGLFGGSKRRSSAS